MNASETWNAAAACWVLPGWSCEAAAFAGGPWGSAYLPVGADGIPFGWETAAEDLDTESFFRAPQHRLSLLPEGTARRDMTSAPGDDMNSAARPVLIGWSLGAWFALAAAAAAPQHFGRVILAAFRPRFPAAAVEAERAALRLDPVAYAAAFRRRVYLGQGTAGRPVDEEISTPERLRRLDFGLSLLAAVEVGPERLATARDRLAEYGATLELWHGERDRIAPCSEAAACAAAVPGLPMRVARGGGHAPFLAPEAIRWWRESPQAGPVGT